ncbi:MAG: DUF6446 family protein [Pseudomonadota bacterium]
MGKVLSIIIVLCALIAGGSMYYLQVYHFYTQVEPNGETDVMLTEVENGAQKTLRYQAFKAIDAYSSPIRYRGCFTTDEPLDQLRAAYEPYARALPLVGPRWFDCFDATEIGEALEQGRAQAFLGTRDITYGIDRVVAITEDGKGFIWHQINRCGEVVFDGDPVPEDCPKPPPQNAQGAQG